MRWYTFLIILIHIIFILLTLFFFINYQFESIKKFQKFTLSNKWTLTSRNELRIKQLIKKYNLLLNLTFFKTNINSNKTLIYSCQSFCGGWGDRLRGILSTYILSLLTNRHFMIDMNYPCSILKVIQPNFINWTFINYKSINRTRLYINTMRSWQKTYNGKIANIIKYENFSEVWSSYDDIYLTTNSDYMILALRNKYMSKRVEELFKKIPLSQITMQTLFAFIFEFLFKPSNLVKNRVDFILSTLYNRNLICFHIRIGKNPTNPLDHAFTARTNTTKAMIDFTDKKLFNKNLSSLVFVTSDSGQAVSEVLQHYSNNSMTIIGPILHIDRFDRRSSNICDGFIKVLSDFYLLGECQISILSKSGFSYWANRRRNNPNENLYTYNEKIGEIRKN